MVLQYIREKLKKFNFTKLFSRKISFSVIVGIILFILLNFVFFGGFLKPKSVRNAKFQYFETDTKEFDKWNGFHKQITNIYSMEELSNLYLNKGIYMISQPPNASFVGKKVRIVSAHFNRLDFFILQHESIKRFVKDYQYNFEYIPIINCGKDAKKTGNSYLDENLYEKFVNYCEEENLSCVIFDDKMREKIVYNYLMKCNKVTQSCHCANIFQWGLEKYAFSFDGLFLMLDSDVFFYDHFNIRKFFQHNDIIVAGINNYRISSDGKMVDWLTNAIVFLDPGRLEDKHDFNMRYGVIHNTNTDVGGSTHYYFEKHEKMREKWYHLYFFSLRNEEEIKTVVENQKIRDFFIDHKKKFFSNDQVMDSWYYDDICMIHIKRGGNWDLGDPKRQINRGKHYLSFWMEYFKNM